MALIAIGAAIGAYFAFDLTVAQGAVVVFLAYTSSSTR